MLRQLGMWSDQMGMAYMGYIVIDKQGQVTKVDRQLPEARGAAPASVNQILAAVDRAGA